MGRPSGTKDAVGSREEDRITREEEAMSQPFDMQKAREICGRIKGYEDPDGGNCGDFEAAEMFPAALDEIVRLRRECRECINANTYAQAKRIAELEREQHLWRYALHSNEINLVLKNEKQRAALKKLGETIRARGKALVEERARFEYYVQNENCESWPEARRKYPELEKKYIGIAREQLRREGKIGNSELMPNEQVGTGVFLLDQHGLMLTKEQRAALDVILTLFDPTTAKDQDRLEAGLRAKQVLHRLSMDTPLAWKVTEERKAAIESVLGFCELGADDTAVLRAMLEEVRP